MGVFDGVGEGEVAGRAPGAAVVEVDDIPAVAADGLGEVEVFFVAGEAVEKDDGWVWAWAFGDVGEGVEHGSVAGDLKCFERGRIGFVIRWIGCQSRRKLCRDRGAAKHEEQTGGRNISKKGHDAIVEKIVSIARANIAAPDVTWQFLYRRFLPCYATPT